MLFDSFTLNVTPGAMRRVSVKPEKCEITVEIETVGIYRNKETFLGAGSEWKTPSGQNAGPFETFFLTAAYREFSRKTAHLSLVTAS